MVCPHGSGAVNVGAWEGSNVGLQDQPEAMGARLRMERAAPTSAFLDRRSGAVLTLG